jgi:hypothetical protein
VRENWVPLTLLVLSLAVGALVIYAAINPADYVAAPKQNCTRAATGESKLVVQAAGKVVMSVRRYEYVYECRFSRWE